jgi:hypothetical protein
VKIKDLVRGNLQDAIETVAYEFYNILDDCDDLSVEEVIQQIEEGIREFSSNYDRNEVVRIVNEAVDELELTEDDDE